MDAEKLRLAVLALLRVVDERDPGLRGYYIDAERFNDLRAALAAQPAQAGAPGHTDLMVTPESVGPFLDANHAPAQAGDDAGVVEVVDATARAICEAYSCGYSAGCAGSPSSVRSSDLEWLIAKHATTQPAQAGEAVSLSRLVGHPDSPRLSADAAVARAIAAAKGGAS